MENIVRHIETLLRRHDYVIVPDLGGFLFQKEKALIGPDQQTPPLSRASFNPLMNLSDGLLAIEVSRSEAVSFREAVQLVTQFAEHSKEQLSKGKTVEFGALGQLYPGEDKKILFRQSDKTDFIPANFGLSTLHFAKREMEAMDERERRTVKLVLPTAKTIVRYASVAALAGLLYFAWPALSDSYHNFSTLNPLSKLNRTEVAEEAVVPAAETTAVETEMEMPAETTILAEPEPELNHHVIVSAMAKESDAEAFCNYLKTRGYEGAHYLDPVRTYRIAIQSFAEKNEAIAYMTELRASEAEFAEAWVLSQ